MTRSSAVKDVIPSAGWRRGLPPDVVDAEPHTYEYHFDVGDRRCCVCLGVQE